MLKSELDVIYLCDRQCSLTGMMKSDTLIYEERVLLGYVLSVRQTLQMSWNSKTRYRNRVVVDCALINIVRVRDGVRGLEV